MYRPTARGPFDRCAMMEFRFTNAGENIALAPTLDIAHSGLMHSPGHRANILRPEFGRLGSGIVDGGNRANDLPGIQELLSN